MAKIVFEFEDAVRDELVEAMCAMGGYQPQSGKTPGEFATGRVVQFCRDNILGYRNAVAQAAASASVTANAANILSDDVVAVSVE